MARDKCIVISTHILEEVEAVCTRTIIISQGKILIDTTPKEIKEKYNCTLDEAFRRITKKQIA
jgi:ABC-2 type transport system ATP-binding protein